MAFVNKIASSDQLSSRIGYRLPLQTSVSYFTKFDVDQTLAKERMVTDNNFLPTEMADSEYIK